MNNKKSALVIMRFFLYLKPMKKKLPRWWRIVKWCLDCLWNHVLFPVGQLEDDFMKNLKDRKK